MLKFESREQERWVLIAGISAILSVVCDGWSGKPGPFVHQLLLVPFDLVYGLGLFFLLRDRERVADQRVVASARRLPPWWLGFLVLYEVAAAGLIGIESRHFRGFGYHLSRAAVLGGLAVVVSGWAWYLLSRRGSAVFAAVLMSYAAGLIVALVDFPLSYLRSDMLPVIGWADQRLLAHLNPYGTMHVGARLYDFPYLPGMLVAYLPVAALHVDLRFASCAYVLALACLIAWCARGERRAEVGALLGLFLLCPFLQYRHELYIEPHWFLLVLAVILMQRRRFVWAAWVWGCGCAVYQLSWILLPFVLLNAYRRRGLGEAAKIGLAAVGGALVIAGPFLRSAWRRIGSNTVGQWSRLPHALADPINLSYWLTYIIRPDQLRWLQAAVLVGMFAFCWLRGRCASLTDTLRWMCWALGMFIPLNVLVDGYFYLTLLLLLLLYVCAANGWWREADVQKGSALEVSSGMPT